MPLDSEKKKINIRNLLILNKMIKKINYNKIISNNSNNNNKTLLNLKIKIKTINSNHGLYYFIKI